VGRVASRWFSRRYGPRTGRPVVLVPDAGRPAALWPDHLVARLVGRGHRVVRLDLWDQGRSPRAEGPYGFDDLAAGLGEALRTLGGRAPGLAAGEPLVVGFGLGGSLALEVAVSGSAPVGAVVAAGATGWYADPGLPGPEEMVAVALVWRRREADADPSELVAALGREHRALAAPASRPDALAARAEAQRWVRWGFNPTDSHRAAWLAAPSRWDALGAVAGPVVVVHGTDDPWLPLAHGRRLAACVGPGGSPLVEVEGAGHVLDAPMCDAIVAAVGELGGRSAR